ncbi:MAG TPA: type II glyceraldehyde-3-phosphate dehydrogenase [Ignisphaera sp.]|nr:type II glyceraldehyde-3-phosphate dehydrogenase [Ignisphaera sp.]
MVRVGVIGFGTIGKRVADAISKQEDMELIGVAKTRPDYKAVVAVEKGYRLYVPKERIELFENTGIKISGSIDELLDRVDVIVDATPGGVGIKNKEELYKHRDVKVVFQGGEKPGVAEISFNALANYEEAIGKRYVRVVSCNTTAILRIISAFLLNNIALEKIRVFIARRGADPHEYSRGPIHDVVLDPPTIPSHHAVDVKSVIPKIDIVTSAIAIPVTLAHLHFVHLTFKEGISLDKIVDILYKTPRILVVESTKGFKSVGQLFEWAKDIGRYRNDIPENIVFRESIYVSNREALLIMAVHQESIVIPENIDAIRALTGYTDKWDSIKKTDRSLNLFMEGKVYG